jgi:hypothetical protein
MPAHSPSPAAHPKAADHPDPAQMAIWRSMPPERKLAIAAAMRSSMLALKRAWFRSQDPSASEAEIDARLRAWMLHGTD